MKRAHLLSTALGLALLAAPAMAGQDDAGRDRPTPAAARSDGAVSLAQSGGTGAGNRGGRAALPPGDSVPGWSGSRGGGGLPPGDSVPGWSGPRAGGAQAPQQGRPGGPLVSPLGERGVTPGGAQPRSAFNYGAPGFTSGPGTTGATGGEPARVGGAPPGDTSRGVGSSGIGGAGVGIGGLR